MSKVPLHPFKNECDTLQISDLTIENRLDRISIFGSLDITLDHEGLKSAKKLTDVLNLIVTEMEKSDLPPRIEVIKPEMVKNPFA